MRDWKKIEKNLKDKKSYFDERVLKSLREDYSFTEYCCGNDIYRLLDCLHDSLAYIRFLKRELKKT